MPLAVTAGARQGVCASTLLLAIWVGVLEAQQVLYPLDVASVLCEQDSESGRYRFRNPQQDIQLEVTIPTQSAAKAKIHVPSIFRTSGDFVALWLSLKDSAGVSIVPPGTYFPLTEIADRRLSSQSGAISDFSSDEADSGAAAQCEGVFLLDGRSPVDLPDTWAEAREAFRSVCELELGLDAEACAKETLEVFRAFPSDSSGFGPEGNLCASLEQSISKHSSGAAALQARRLKAGGGAGSYSTAAGAPAAGAWTSSSRPGLPDYGYATSRLRSTYPRGYTETSLGYSGRTRALPRGPSSTSVSVLAGAHFGLFGPWRFRSFARTPTGGGADEGDCEDPAAPCEWNLNDQELVREDLMSFGFYPNTMVYPLKLTVTGLAGAAVVMASRVCPPPGWNASSQITWEQGDDIFFSLVEVENLEEDGVDVGAIVGITFGVLGGLGGLLLLVLCINRRRIKLHMRLSSMKKERRKMRPTAGVQRALGTQSTITCSMKNEKGAGFQAVYRLAISSEGYVGGTGSINQEEQEQQCQIFGLARMESPSEIIIRFQGHFVDWTSEVSLTLSDDAGWGGSGEYVSKKPGRGPPWFEMSECTVAIVTVARPGANPGAGASLPTARPVVMGQPIESNDPREAVGKETE